MSLYVSADCLFHGVVPAADAEEKEVSLSILPLSSLISYSFEYEDMESTIRVFTAMSGGGNSKQGEEKLEVVPSASFILHNAEADPTKLIAVLRDAVAAHKAGKNGP